MDGHSYYDISLSGKGVRYPDPHSKFLAGEDNYPLLTLDRAAGTLTVEIKSLADAVLDRKVFPKGGRHARDRDVLPQGTFVWCQRQGRNPIRQVWSWANRSAMLPAIPLSHIAA